MAVRDRHIQSGRTQVIAGHAEQLLHLDMVRYIVEPVAVGEAKKNSQRLTNDAPELTDRFRVGDIQLVHRIDEAI